MEHPEFEKSKIYIISGMDNFDPHGVVTKNILKRASGNVALVFIDSGEELTEKFSRFDQFIQIIEGEAEVLIDNNSFSLSSGQSIIIPANTNNTIKANEKFKMISTIIKSGYDI